MKKGRKVRESGRFSTFLSLHKRGCKFRAFLDHFRQISFGKLTHREKNKSRCANCLSELLARTSHQRSPAKSFEQSTQRLCSVH